MHQSESVVRLVAEYAGLQDDLGQKDKRGILQLEACLFAVPSLFNLPFTGQSESPDGPLPRQVRP
jgi:hypothetical protein